MKSQISLVSLVAIALPDGYIESGAGLQVASAPVIPAQLSLPLPEIPKTYTVIKPGGPIEHQFVAPDNSLNAALYNAQQSQQAALDAAQRAKNLNEEIAALQHEAEERANIVQQILAEEHTNPAMVLPTFAPLDIQTHDGELIYSTESAQTVEGTFAEVVTLFPPPSTTQTFPQSFETVPEDQIPTYAPHTLDPSMTYAEVVTLYPRGQGPFGPMPVGGETSAEAPTPSVISPTLTPPQQPSTGIIVEADEPFQTTESGLVSDDTTMTTDFSAETLFQSVTIPTVLPLIPITEVPAIILPVTDATTTVAEEIEVVEEATTPAPVISTSTPSTTTTVTIPIVNISATTGADPIVGITEEIVTSPVSVPSTQSEASTIPELLPIVPGNLDAVTMAAVDPTTNAEEETTESEEVQTSSETTRLTQTIVAVVAH